jgi:DNA-binding NarL/FixJ family response regulator
MSLRVLVVDDAADLRGLVRLMLDLEDDFEVVGEAGTGAEAIVLSQTLQPDVVLLDVAMPVMDGLQALGELRRLCPNCKVVMFSAFDSPAVVDEATQRGAVAYIDKGGVVDLVGELRRLCPAS